MAKPKYAFSSKAGEEPFIQAAIFDKEMYTQRQAQAWLKSHKLRAIKKVDVTANYLRYRLSPPDVFRRFITINVREGVKYIIGFL